MEGIIKSLFLLRATWSTSLLQCGKMSRRGLDDGAQELLAFLGTLHNLAGGLDLLGVLRSVR